ncbi:hypothetical protein [Breoghania sp. L-A4]|uniref:hypothetical protein n=1 Tax=Breoghania sp. L-A4 TaxID=2304600 RepID=UPI0013C30153|nr:hypothetical protein [Breoghania sp. L-A4]
MSPDEAAVLRNPVVAGHGAGHRGVEQALAVGGDINGNESQKRPKFLIRRICSKTK